MTANQSKDIDNLMDAIEAFVDAKIQAYVHRNSCGPGLGELPKNVDDTRETLREQLAEVLT